MSRERVRGLSLVSGIETPSDATEDAYAVVISHTSDGDLLYLEYRVPEGTIATTLPVTAVSEHGVVIRLGPNYRIHHTDGTATLIVNGKQYAVDNRPYTIQHVERYPATIVDDLTYYRVGRADEAEKSARGVWARNRSEALAAARRRIGAEGTTVAETDVDAWSEFEPDPPEENEDGSRHPEHQWVVGLS